MCVVNLLKRTDFISKTQQVRLFINISIKTTKFMWSNDFSMEHNHNIMTRAKTRSAAKNSSAEKRIPEPLVSGRYTFRPSKMDQKGNFRSFFRNLK